MYGLNTSLELRPGHFRYIERKQAKNGLAHVLTSIEFSPQVERALALAREEITIPALIKRLSSQVRGARGMVKEMVEAQLLISELEHTVTGEDAFDRVCRRIMALKGARAEKQLVTRIDRLLRTCEEPLEVYQQLARILAVVTEWPEGSPAVKADMVYNGRFTLNKKWVDVLAAEFERVQPLLKVDRDEELARFRKAFLERFESRQVPLLEALDSADGIGYGHARPGYCEDLPLLEDLELPGRSPKQPYLQDTAGMLKENLVERAMLENRTVVLLSDQDLRGLRAPGNPTGDGLYWLGSILTASARDLDKGNFLFLGRSGGGVSGLELSGRFCDADPALAGYVQNAAEEQQRRHSDRIYAEIAHLPEPRLGNILQRPHLTGHEIVYLAASNLPFEKRIHASDLMVSVEGDEVILHSKRLGKRVVPRLTSAHNFSTGLPIYRFLCDVAGQGAAYLWQWGHLESRTFLPRVQYGHWMLSRARWRIEKERFPSLFDPPGDFRAEWEETRRRLNIPRFVQIVDSDREFLIDSESCWSVEELRAHLEKGKIKLVEFADGMTGLLDGWCHEVVLSFLQTPQPGKDHERADLDARNNERREFLPCSEWIYLKIYCGPRTADVLLTEFFGPLLTDMVRNGKIDMWFFIRYADPDPHLRIRYKGANGCLLSNELNSLLAAGRIQKVQYDTYRRELERYSGLDYGLTESIFHTDSVTVTSLLKQLDTEEDRWLAGLTGADRLMKDFGLNLPARLNLAEAGFESLFLELKGENTLKIQLDVKYRRDRKLIEACLAEAASGWEQIFKFRSRALKKKLKKQGDIRLTEVASYVHMFFNRLLLSQSRMQEMILYYYLKKYYRSLQKQFVKPVN
ncbi:hypothetical protein GCM10023091_28460 [Ravibacter arvi]|uniref:Uncharacterized protein n=1 Tax=Ravibacter arvi TaxID=2051041 RepID=A0ABP8M3M1_9BACT